VRHVARRRGALLFFGTRAVCPTQVVVWDFDAVGPNDRVGTVLLDFKTIEQAPMAPTWLSIYGAPDDASPGPNKRAMNKYPDQATNYRWVAPW
jgi:hypothetical protein